MSKQRRAEQAEDEVKTLKSEYAEMLQHWRGRTEQAERALAEKVGLLADTGREKSEWQIAAGVANQQLVTMAGTVLALRTQLHAAEQALSQAHEWNCQCDWQGVGGAPKTRVDPACERLRTLTARPARSEE